MSWQDDLRQLDQALAMGQIAADDYRKRRDQLLAAAAGSAASPAAPAAEQPSAPQQPVQQQPMPQQPAPPPPLPVQQPGPSHGPDSGPFAPPFRWEPSADATQVVPGDNPDRTQVVSPVHSQDADRTQVFQPLSQPGQQRSTAQPPWGQQQQGRPDGAAPPWGDDQYGAPVSGLNPTWLTQGPEVFESSGGDKKSGTFLKIAIALVVVIGIGVGAFFIIRGQGDDNPQAGGTTTTQSQPPTSTSRPKDALEIAPLPGQATERAEVKEFSDVEATDSLKDGEKTAYKNAGAAKSRLVVGSLPRSVGALVLTVEVSSPQTAKSAVTELGRLQREFTMKDYAGTVPAGVIAQQFTKSETLPAVIRGHYTHKSTVVRVQVAGDDMAQIAKVFDEILAAQLAELPADA